MAGQPLSLPLLPLLLLIRRASAGSGSSGALTAWQIALIVVGGVGLLLLLLLLRFRCCGLCRCGRPRRERSFIKDTMTEDPAFRTARGMTANPLAAVGGGRSIPATQDMPLLPLNRVTEQQQLDTAPSPPPPSAADRPPRQAATVSTISAAGSEAAAPPPPPDRPSVMRAPQAMLRPQLSQQPLLQQAADSSDEEDGGIHDYEEPALPSLPTPPPPLPARQQPPASKPPADAPPARRTSRTSSAASSSGTATQAAPHAAPVGRHDSVLGNTPLPEWTEEQVTIWMQRINLEHEYILLLAHLDGKELARLTKADLEALGIKSIPAKLRLLQARDALLPQTPVSKKANVMYKRGVLHGFTAGTGATPAPPSLDRSRTTSVTSSNLHTDASAITSTLEQELIDFMSNQGQTQYLEMFAAEGIEDMTTLKSYSEQELRALGVKSGHAKKLIMSLNARSRAALALGHELDEVAMARQQHAERLTHVQLESHRADGRPWEVPREAIELGSLLGFGAFGNVHLAVVRGLFPADPEAQVAVKSLNENAEELDKLDFLAEIQVMQRFEPHRNVVSLLGICTVSEPMCIVVEFMKDGNLRDFLRRCRPTLDKPEPSVTPEQLMAFMVDIACGMEYLASRGCIHRDLATRNVLLDLPRAAIADFGLARYMDAEYAYLVKNKQRKLPTKWLAPEALMDQAFTTKTDVWSFGVTLWEILLMGAIPYPGIGTIDLFVMLTRDHYRMPKPGNCSDDLYQVVRDCWHTFPDARPSFGELRKRLEQLAVHANQHIRQSADLTYEFMAMPIDEKEEAALRHHYVNVNMNDVLMSAMSSLGEDTAASTAQQLALRLSSAASSPAASGGVEAAAAPPAAAAAAAEAAAAGGGVSEEAKQVQQRLHRWGDAGDESQYAFLQPKNTVVSGSKAPVPAPLGSPASPAPTFTTPSGTPSRSNSVSLTPTSTLPAVPVMLSSTPASDVFRTPTSAADATARSSSAFLTPQDLTGLLSTPTDALPATPFTTPTASTPIIQPPKEEAPRRTKSGASFAGKPASKLNRVEGAAAAASVKSRPVPPTPTTEAGDSAAPAVVVAVSAARAAKAPYEFLTPSNHLVPSRDSINNLNNNGGGDAHNVNSINSAAQQDNNNPFKDSEAGTVLPAIPPRPPSRSNLDPRKVDADDAAAAAVAAADEPRRRSPPPPEREPSPEPEERQEQPDLPQEPQAVPPPLPPRSSVVDPSTLPQLPPQPVQRRPPPAVPAPPSTFAGDSLSAYLLTVDDSEAAAGQAPPAAPATAASEAFEAALAASAPPTQTEDEAAGYLDLGKISETRTPLSMELLYADRRAVALAPTLLAESSTDDGYLRTVGEEEQPKKKKMPPPPPPVRAGSALTPLAAGVYGTAVVPDLTPTPETSVELYGTVPPSQAPAEVVGVEIYGSVPVVGARSAETPAASESEIYGTVAEVTVKVDHMFDQTEMARRAQLEAASALGDRVNDGDFDLL